MNTRGLTVLQRLAKGGEIITLSTSNPNAPGNSAVLALFSTAQTALQTTEATAEAARTQSKEATILRNDALDAWDAAIVVLAGFTESATGGDAAKITSTGFNVRATPAAPQPVAQVENVRVSYDGTPGYSKVRWKREEQADAYMVQCSPEPITEASWRNMGTVTEAKFQGNGATPGQKCWYRVAGVNRMGQGPWSEPALRPVM